MNNYNKEEISNSTFFFRKNLSFKISNLNYLPRWIIVLIDCSVLMASFVFTYLLFEGSGLDYIIRTHSTRFIVLFFVVNVFFFWLFRTYAGIIRHSSYIDAVKIFFSQSAVFVFFLFLNFYFDFIYGQKVYSNIALFINVILTFCGLFLYRLVVKQTFDFYISKKGNQNLIKIIVYGTDANALYVAKALKFETPSRFKIIGFVDKNNHNSTKRMLDLPIFIQGKKLSSLMDKVGAEGIIIADKSLSKEEQLILVDQCLEFNFKIFTAPSITDWENQQEISKNVKKIQIEDLLERQPIVLDNFSISKQLEGKKILISGGAGSIGSEIVRQVLRFKPSEIIILDQAETPLHNLSLEIQNLNPNFEVHTIIGDIRNKEAINSIFNQFKPQIVFHAAAYKHVPLMEDNPSQAILTNVEGTKNLADLSCEYKVEKFVMISTDKAVNPSSIMGASKRIAEIYVQSLQFKKKCYNTKFITTRFGNVLGSNGSVVPLFSKQIAEGGPITVTHPDIIRYFMTIPEACQLVLEAAVMGRGGEIYIFDMGKPIKIIDLANKMIRLAGFSPGKEIKIQITGLRPGEKLYEELLNHTSKTLNTHHPKIMIEQVVNLDNDFIHDEIDELIGMSRYFEKEDIVAKMKKLVPEFKSMNSHFELLDNII
ncbi:polysaccharide biosynthesis protein [Flavobacterium sp.]|uniref:polysaccharide biosynthesis protein n=1 Tax=Flavobacterium sp. TaxID=239 RepID=UPI0038FC4D0F